jgi:hypothetical protein
MHDYEPKTHITVDDVVAAGACVEGVYEFIADNQLAETLYPVKDLLAIADCEAAEYIVKAAQPEILNQDNYGYGYNYNYGDGYGDGYGHGDGYGGDNYGYDYGHGQGDGYGDGDNYGYGDGHGQGDGYGDGNGYGSGHGDGDGHGYGSSGIGTFG